MTVSGNPGEERTMAAPLNPLFYPAAFQLPLLDHSYPGTLDQKSEVTLHITVGSTVLGAYQTFKTSKSKKDGGRGRTSCHFIIGQAGDVFQLLPISDVAFHASQVNMRSIGIEHVGIPPGTVIGGKPRSLPVTELQYKASAALVKWLCERMNVPCDRRHVRGHYEASPRDKHPCLPSADVDRVVKEVEVLTNKEKVQ